MNIYFRVRVNTKEGEEVFITGSSPLLGYYYPDKAFRMEDCGENELVIRRENGAAWAQLRADFEKMTFEITCS